MADIHTAILYTLHLEDAKLSGVITDDPHDAGGRTRYGICERFHPDLERHGYYSTMSATAALTVALMLYQSEYAKPLMLDQIVDQREADSLLASAVNIGIEPAVKILQSAVGVAEDGCMGELTLRAANAIAPAALVSALVSGQCEYYKRIVLDKPAQAVYLRGWLNRAQAINSATEAA